MWLDECTNRSVSGRNEGRSFTMRSVLASGIELMSASYRSIEPSLKCSHCSAVSSATTVRPIDRRSAGSWSASDCQMAPVPPRWGKRNLAFGPQLTSSRRSTRLRSTRARSTVATRSPIHVVPIVWGS
jgi:hypothetical protein